MRFDHTAIEDVLVIGIEAHQDERGLFGRVWCSDEFSKLGLDIAFLQANTGYSHQKGTLRGLHIQREPFGEWKLVRCTQGRVFDVIVDLRPDSGSYLNWYGLELSSDNRRSVLVPPGCAHGYQTLEADSELFYLTSERYVPAAATGVRFDDEAFAIAWPLPPGPMSDADRSWPDWIPNDPRSARMEQ